LGKRLVGTVGNGKLHFRMLPKWTKNNYKVRRLFASSLTDLDIKKYIVFSYKRVIGPTLLSKDLLLILSLPKGVFFVNL